MRVRCCRIAEVAGKHLAERHAESDRRMCMMDMVMPHAAPQWYGSKRCEWVRRVVVFLDDHRRRSGDDRTCHDRRRGRRHGALLHSDDDGLADALLRELNHVARGRPLGDAVRSNMRQDDVIGNAVCASVR